MSHADWCLLALQMGSPSVQAVEISGGVSLAGLAWAPSTANRKVQLSNFDIGFWTISHAFLSSMPPTRVV